MGHAQPLAPQVRPGDVLHVVPVAVVEHHRQVYVDRARPALGLALNVLPPGEEPDDIHVSLEREQRAPRERTQRLARRTLREGHHVVGQRRVQVDLTQRVQLAEPLDQRTAADVGDHRTNASLERQLVGRQHLHLGDASLGKDGADVLSPQAGSRSAPSPGARPGVETLSMPSANAATTGWGLLVSARSS